MATDLIYIIPELVLLTLGCIILVADTFAQGNDRGFTYSLAQSSLLVVIILLIYFQPQDTACDIHLNSSDSMRHAKSCKGTESLL